MAVQVQDDKKFTGVRLATDVLPSRYELFLKPNLKDFSYEGHVRIELGFSDQFKPRQEIVVHANEIVIEEGHVESAANEGAKNALKKVTYSKDSETATLEFESPIEVGKPFLFLGFKGSLNDKMKGFYRTAFKISDNTVYAATTQFEATDARRCFPCWDEPAIKSVFSVTLAYSDTLNVGQKSYPIVGLSNTNEKSSKVRADGLVEVTFEDTPKMSTYLLAFIVGPFEKLAGTDGKRPVNVYTTPGKTSQGQFALEVACKSLPYYEEYFKIPYPLPKMDLIAVPDFASGAMENWGLVTYRETCLLVDPANTATDRKQFIALVVAHELAHQWFGNLVTMEWWTHLWLNEGFASFMEFLCVDHIFPEYDIWSQFVTDSYGRAMDLDSLHSSHPIEVPVIHPDEIDEIFDDISYNKGASVIRMLYNYIGDESFRVGMKNYLEKFAYKNACTEDLWESLEAASNKPVCKIMSGWTSQKGYPWISTSVELKDGNAKLTFTQSKFTADGKLPDAEANMKWMIPMFAIKASEPTKVIELKLFEEKTVSATIEGVGDDWVKLNPGTVGLYRTAYPDVLSQRLWPAITSQTLPAMDRLGIQNDFFSLCKAGKVNTVEYLKLLQAFRGERNFTVWSSIDSCLGTLNMLLLYTDFQDKLHSFGLKLYQDIFTKLTWQPHGDENHTDAMTRALVINRLVSFNHKGVIEEAQRKFKSHLEGSQPLPADLRGAVYRAVSSYGDDSAFESLFKIYRTAELHEEKNRAARALGFTKDPERLERVIEFAMSDEVRNQDKIFVIIPMAMSNPAVGWRIFQEQKEFFKEKYESGHLMARLIKYCTENFATEEKAQEVAKFFEENKFPGAERTIQQSLETIRLSSDWLKRDAETMKTFLSS